MCFMQYVMSVSSVAECGGAVSLGGMYNFTMFLHILYIFIALFPSSVLYSIYNIPSYSCSLKYALRYTKLHLFLKKIQHPHSPTNP